LDDGDWIWIGIMTFVLFVGVGLTIWGVGTFSNANYTNPLQGVQQSASGILATGIGMTIVLVVLGAASVVGTVLAFLLKLISRE